MTAISPEEDALKELPRWARLAYAAKCCTYIQGTLNPHKHAFKQMIDLTTSVLEWVSNLASHPIVYQDNTHNDTIVGSGIEGLHESTKINVERTNERIEIVNSNSANRPYDYEHIIIELLGVERHLESQGVSAASPIRAWVSAVSSAAQVARFAIEAADDDYIAGGTTGLGYGMHLGQVDADPESTEEAAVEFAANTCRRAADHGFTQDVCDDFELLLDASKREKWNHDTGVSQRFFSPDSRVERQVIFAINDLCVELCKLIAAHPDGLRHIEWRLLEKTLATALCGIGFDVELTPGSKDGGKDIVASCVLRGKKLVYYLEVKHWRSGKRVSKNEISHFVEITVRDGTDGGLFLSTSGFANEVYGALAEITRSRVRLGNEVKVISLCQQFVQRRGRAIWTPHDVLPKILFEETLE